MVTVDDGHLEFSRTCPRALILGPINQDIFINGLNGGLRGCLPLLADDLQLRGTSSATQREFKSACQCLQQWAD